MATTQTIVNIAENLQQAIVDTYAEYGVTLPTRRYHASGDISIEGCDEVIIQFLGISPGLANNPDAWSVVAQKIPRTFVANFQVWVNRCGPNTATPNNAQIETAAHTRMVDAWVLGPGLQAMIKANEVLCGCSATDIINVVPAGPEGNMASTILNINIGLNGGCGEEVGS